MSTLLQANKTKISNNSHRIAITKVEKNVDEVVNANDEGKTKKIKIVQFINILGELKIIRELIQKDSDKNIIRYNNCSYLLNQ